MSDRCAYKGCGQPRSNHVHDFIGVADWKQRHAFVPLSASAGAVADEPRCAEYVDQRLKTPCARAAGHDGGHCLYNIDVEITRHAALVKSKAEAPTDEDEILAGMTPDATLQQIATMIAAYRREAFDAGRLAGAREERGRQCVSAGDPDIDADGHHRTCERRTHPNSRHPCDCGAVETK